MASRQLTHAAPYLNDPHNTVPTSTVIPCPADPLDCDNGFKCGICFMAVAQPDCMLIQSVPVCSGSVAINEICDAEDESGCGTNNDLNNCFGGGDMYQRVDCGIEVASMIPPSPPPDSPSAAPAIAGSLSGVVALLLLLIGAFLLKRRRRLRLHRAQANARALKEQELEVLNAVAALPLNIYHGTGSSSDECSICLSTFVIGEEIRTLPCGHTFRAKCVDAWLTGKGAAAAGDTPSTRQPPRCPLCKAIPLTNEQLAKAGFEKPPLVSAPVFSRLGPAPSSSAATEPADVELTVNTSTPAPEAAAPEAAAPEAAAPAAAPWDQLVGWFSPGGTHHPGRPQAADAGPFA